MTIETNAHVLSHAAIFTIATVSAWLGESVSSMTCDRPCFAWFHASVTTEPGTPCPAAVCFDAERETLTVHCALPDVIYFALMGYAENSGLQFEELT